MRRSERALLHVPGSCAGVATTDTFGDFTGSRFRHAHDLKQIASNDEAGKPLVRRLQEIWSSLNSNMSLRSSAAKTADGTYLKRPQKWQLRLEKSEGGSL
jgi:hypothetical protein